MSELNDTNAAPAPAKQRRIGPRQVLALIVLVLLVVHGFALRWRRVLVRQGFLLVWLVFLAVAAGAAVEFVWRGLERVRVFGDVGDPPMTRFLARQLATAHWFDISAARRDLGYVPQVPLDEGFARLRAALV